MQLSDDRRFNIGCYSIIIIVIVIIIAYYIKTNEINNEVNNYGRYAIGVTYDKTIATKGNDYINYYFLYKGLKYYGSANLELDIKVPNGRYYVIFSTKNPKRNFIYFNRPISDSLIVAPFNGWDKLP